MRACFIYENISHNYITCARVRNFPFAQAWFVVHYDVERKLFNVIFCFVRSLVAVLVNEFGFLSNVPYLNKGRARITF